MIIIYNEIYIQPKEFSPFFCFLFPYTTYWLFVIITVKIQTFFQTTILTIPFSLSIYLNKQSLIRLENVSVSADKIERTIQSYINKFSKLFNFFILGILYFQFVLFFLDFIWLWLWQWLFFVYVLPVIFIPLLLSYLDDSCSARLLRKWKKKNIIIGKSLLIWNCFCLG